MVSENDNKPLNSNMRLVKSKNTKPEILVRKFLHSKGFRFRLHKKMLPGNPDIVLPKYSTVIFVNGCFWHGHDCNIYGEPKKNFEFWNQKIKNNVIRDQKNIRQLLSLGWKVIIIWECELKSSSRNNTFDNLHKTLNLTIRHAE